MKEPIIINVRGNPKPWGNNQKGLEIAWREEIKKACPKIEKIKDIRLKVEIIFYLNDKNIKRPDLDNLAKPVLDTICKISNPQGEAKRKGLYGILTDYDDNRVFELILTKREREKEGATIKVWRL